MQETTECNQRDFIPWHMTEHAHHGREYGHIDAVRESISIMGAYIGQLDEVIPVFKEIKDNGVCHPLQCRRIKCSVLFNGLKRIVDRTDCIDSCLFFNDIGRRRQFMCRIHGGNRYRLNANLTQFPNIVNGYWLSLDKIASSCRIEQALPKNHPVF